jgi:penicillin-binding protein 1B
MREQAFVTEAEYQAALTAPVSLAPPKKSNDAAYFLAALRDTLAERYSMPRLLSEGWKIYTTLDPLLQHAAVTALKELPPGPQGALVALDPKTGAILAWVGGTNFQTNPFDHIASAKRQPGSAFKPLVALAALESRKATTATLLDDKPLTLKGLNGSWTPQNYDRKYRGKASVWDAVVYSLNVPMVRLAMQTGLASIIDVARRARIESPLREDLSLALGTSEVSLLELTGAYSTLASGGLDSTPYLIQDVMGPDGTILEAQPATSTRAFAPDVIYIVTQMLEEVLNSGTGKAARAAGFTAPAAGKTGTSENFQDAWFEGYTPNLVCGVWVGYDIPKSLGHSAAGIALPVWTTFMKKATALGPPDAFQEPAGLVWKTIDPESGLLAKSGCPERRKAAFLSGTEPTQSCPLHPGGLMGFFKRWKRNS